MGFRYGLVEAIAVAPLTSGATHWVTFVMKPKTAGAQLTKTWPLTGWDEIKRVGDDFIPCIGDTKCTEAV